MQSRTPRRVAGGLSRSLRGSHYNSMDINHAQTAIRLAIESPEELVLTNYSSTRCRGIPYCS